MFNPGQAAKKRSEKQRATTRINPDKYAAGLVDRYGKQEAAAFAERLNNDVETLHKALNETAGGRVYVDEDPTVVRRTRAFWNQVHNILRKKVKVA